MIIMIINYDWPIPIVNGLYITRYKYQIKYQKAYKHKNCKILFLKQQNKRQLYI